MATTIWTPGTDWGSYLFWDTSIQFDWEILVKAGIAFCAHKSDQEQIDANYGNYSTLLNIKSARERGVLVNGTYSWLFPHVNQGYWIDRYIAATEKEKPDFISVDAEQVSWVDDQGVSHIPSPNQVAENLLALCEGYSAAFPELPFLLYTRPDWIKTYAYPAIPYLHWDYFMAGWPDWGSPLYDMPLEKIVKGDMRQVLTYNPLSWKMINLISDGFTPPKVKDSDVVKIWQISSRMLPFYIGKTIPATHQYDWNFFLGNLDDLLKWAKKESSSSGGGGGETSGSAGGTSGSIITPPPSEGGEITTMPLLFDKTVPYNQRAWILQVNKDQKVQIKYADTYVDAILLDSGGTYFYAEGGACKSIPESYEQTNINIRCQEVLSAGQIPIALYKLNPGAMLKANWNYTRAELPFKENEITRSIITVLHNGAWTWDNILTGKGNWNKFGAIVFEMNSTEGYGVDPIGEDWQCRVLKTVTNHIKYLQSNSFMPNIPVILYTNSTWLSKYNLGNFGVFLSDNKDWLWLWLEGEKEKYPKSTSTFTYLQPIFEATFPLLEDYKPTSVPYGYENRILAIKITGDTQKMNWLTDSGGKATSVSLHLWNSVAAKLFEFFGTTPPTTPPPTEPPPGTSGSTSGSSVIPPSSGGGTDLSGVMAKLNEILDLLKWLVNKIMSIFK